MKPAAQIIPQAVVVGLLLAAPGAFAQSDFAGKELSDIFWQLSDVNNTTPSAFYQYLGRQNFTWCCLKAVADAVEVTDGQLQLRTGYENWIVFDNSNASLAQLYEASQRGQFPCTAQYNGDPQGAPVVQVNYTWLADVCPGWQISSSSNLNAWLQPLSGFLIPAVVFCLSVPRRRKLHVPRAFFIADLAGIKSYLVAPFGAIGAMVMVSIDTLVWLSMCFAFAGPMIMSGLYEAMLDNRVLEFLRLKVDERKLTLDMRCRCLMVILIGNLDLGLEEPKPGEEPHADGASQVRPSGDYLPLLMVGSQQQVSDSGNEAPNSAVSAAGSDLPGPRVQGSDYAAERQAFRSLIPNEAFSSAVDTAGTAEQRNLLSPTHPQTAESRTVTPETHFEQEGRLAPGRRSTASLPASPWRHMEELLYDIRLYDDHIPGRNLSPRQHARHLCGEGFSCRRYEHIEQPRPRTWQIESDIHKTKTRLRTMLHCQYSFGSIVGAPVIFFLGGFVFALLQSLDGLGDEDIAEGLAFGQWYMIIPHIAIVSGLLLAGNNPNILEGVFATEREVNEEDDDIKILGFHYGLAYPSCYKVAWQWARGSTKKAWLDKLIRTYIHTHELDQAGNPERDEDIEYLYARTTISGLDWFFLLSFTLLLLGVPFVLAFLTAFYTPEIGLSCRSLTFTVYACVETAQLLLWLWAYAGPPSRLDKSLPALFRAGGWLDRHGFYHPASINWLFGPKPRPRNLQSFWAVVRLDRRRLWSMRALWCLVYYFLQWLLSFIAIFTALGGTVMQLMGVYSADICYLTVEHWFEPLQDRPMAVISLNSQLMIHEAETMWKPCAISAIIFMTVVSFVGWWYQRRMRDMFTDLVRRIDQSERDDSRMSRFDGGRVRSSLGPVSPGYPATPDRGASPGAMPAEPPAS